MGQSRPLFVYFRHFLDTISIIQIEKSVDGVLGTRTEKPRSYGGHVTIFLLRTYIVTRFESIINPFPCKIATLSENNYLTLILWPNLLKSSGKLHGTELYREMTPIPTKFRPCPFQYSTREQSGFAHRDVFNWIYKLLRCNEEN